MEMDDNQGTMIDLESDMDPEPGKSSHFPRSSILVYRS
jgi:hypothetical protein